MSFRDPYDSSMIDPSISSVILAVAFNSLFVLSPIWILFLGLWLSGGYR